MMQHSFFQNCTQEANKTCSQTEIGVSSVPEKPAMRSLQ